MNERTYYLKIDGLYRQLREAFLIGAQWLAAESDATFTVTNPADGAIVACLPDLSVDHVETAIAMAQAAKAEWLGIGSQTRATVLYRWCALIEANTHELAQVLSAEQGKPEREALEEVRYAASYVRWFAAEAVRIVGDVFDAGDGSDQALVLKAPVGVVAAITPWNFPAAMVTRKVAAALAAGCTVVLKPAQETPLTAIALVQLAEAAGVPAGVLNIVCGTDPAAMGRALCRSPQVNKLTFTGSTRVGKILQQQAAGTIKKLSMELGGNAPFLVFDDADIDAAVSGILQSKFRNAGQTCICVNRVLVHNAVYDEVVARLQQAVENYGNDKAVEQPLLGPLIHSAACERVAAMVDASIAAGATSLATGLSRGESGNFYPATLLGDVSPEMPVFKQEIFGPVIPLLRFDNEHEALALANNSDAGLAAYVYTRDLSRTWRLGWALNVGMVGINKVNISSELVPFGGVNESGYGREGSRHGIEDYLDMKYMAVAVTPVDLNK